MKRKGFEFFYSRTPNDPIDFTEFENFCEFKIPPKYKLFLGFFILGRYNLIQEVFINNPFPKPEPVYYCVFPGKGEGFEPINYFDGFHSIEEMMKMHEQYYLLTENDSSLMRIGSTSISAVNVLLGIGNHNLDEIWIEDWDLGLLKHSEDIFEFVKTIADKENETLEEGVLDTLYKKWGDELWRKKPAGADAV